MKTKNCELCSPQLKNRVDQTTFPRYRGLHTRKYLHLLALLLLEVARQVCVS
jgi:hypothetical protein